MLDGRLIRGTGSQLTGDGPLAGIALQAAQEADPSHSMANLLEISLRTGMSPETLRRLAYSGLGTRARRIPWRGFKSARGHSADPGWRLRRAQPCHGPLHRRCRWPMRADPVPAPIRPRSQGGGIWPLITPPYNHISVALFESNSFPQPIRGHSKLGIVECR